MREIQITDLTSEIEKICAEAYAGNPILVTRPNNDNVVIVSEVAYSELIRTKEQKRRVYILNE